MLVLALTDQLAEGHAHAMKTVHEILPRITDSYQRAYYTGIASERTGQAILQRGAMGSGAMAYDAFRDAMGWYERAEAIRPAGNDDAILRWNTCARLISGNSHIAPHVEAAYEPALERSSRWLRARSPLNRARHRLPRRTARPARPRSGEWSSTALTADFSRARTS
jgi:hypothetical protein